MLGTTNASSTSPFAIENYVIDVLSILFVNQQSALSTKETAMVSKMALFLLVCPARLPKCTLTNWLKPRSMLGKGYRDV
jgi:hypothetical protein